MHLILDTSSEAPTILVVASAWVEVFKGRDPLAQLVDDALAANEAAVCGPVEAELRRELLNERERKKVLPLLGGCHWLEMPPNLWAEAGDLGYLLRRKGVTSKTFDLLIAVYALNHSADLLTADRDFVATSRAGVPLHLLPREATTKGRE